MPNVSEKKRKLLLLLKLLLEKTDEEHAITLPQLLEELKAQGISAERKSVYDDIETLRSVGIEVETRKKKTFQYYIAKRRLSMEDLGRIAAAVRTSQDLSPREAEGLLKKLSTICSRYQAQALLEGTPETESKAAEPQKKRSKEKLVLEYPNAAAQQIAERFAGEVTVETMGKNRQRAIVRADPDQDFFAWLFLNGPDVRLVAPKKYCEQLRERAKTIAKLYKT